MDRRAAQAIPGKRRLLIPAAVILLVFPALAAACQPAPPPPAVSSVEEAVIASDDGRVTLLLPPGALPPGVSPGHLSITLVDPAELPFTFEDEDGTSLVAYHLEPEGLELLEPATIEVELEGAGDLPLLWHVSARDIEQTGAFTVELMEGLSVELDLSAGRGSMSAPLTHFSWFLYGRRDFSLQFEITLEDPGRRMVGETFTVSAVVALRDYASRRVFTYGGGSYPFRGKEYPLHAYQEVVSVDLEVPWPLEGRFLSQNRALSPRVIVDAPPATQVMDSFTARGTFTCTRTGSDMLNYLANINTPWAIETKVRKYTSGPDAGTFEESKTRRWMDSLRLYAYRISSCWPPELLTPRPEPTPAPTPTLPPIRMEEDVAAAVPAARDAEVPSGQVLVFELDGVYFPADDLEVIDAHPPFCHYEHVHGPPITSLLPGPDGEPITRSEHLGECGYGPPNFYLIQDPREAAGDAGGFVPIQPPSTILR